MKLSVIIPAYNEIRTIDAILEKINSVAIEKECIIVDDCSTDGTRQRLEQLQKENNPSYTILFHDKNYGKGRAIRTALPHVRGDYVVIQDADLELDPNDYHKLIAPILVGKTNVVYGNRYSIPVRHGSLLYKIGADAITLLSNLLYGMRISDVAAGYKIFRTQTIQSLVLNCERFEFCFEVTAKLRKRGERIVEIPVYYNPRTREQGKKIRARDGLMAVWTLLKYKFKD